MENTPLHSCGVREAVLVLEANFVANVRLKVIHPSGLHLWDHGMFDHAKGVLPQEYILCSWLEQSPCYVA